MDKHDDKKLPQLPPGSKALPGEQSKWASEHSSSDHALPHLDTDIKQENDADPTDEHIPAFPTQKHQKAIQQKNLSKYRKAVEKIDFIAESRKAADDYAPKTIKITMYFMVIMLVSSFIWSYKSNIDITVNANGRVVPTSRVQVVQNLEGGIISKIHVKEGALVHKGQTLVEMDDTRFKSEYNEKRIRLVVLQGEIYRLRAEANGKDIISFPEKFVQENPEIVEHAQIIFEKNKHALEKNLKILRETYALSEKELDIVRPLARQGVMSHLELIRLEREANTYKGKITELIENHRKLAREEMNKMRAELKVAKEQITASRDRMIRTEVKSPVDGVVNKVHINSIGEVVTPDEKIIEIVPLNDTLSIKLNIEPKDIGFIKKGQEASVKISAYDYAIYGDVRGVVTRISADAIKDEKGQEFYNVTLEADKNHIGKIDDNLTILPGMTVTASITTSKRSILSYFLKPLLKIREEAFVSR